jgi:hypothetical protein|tara:strand:- start:5391 stop:5786 length:396 start_codon:yes stop_codon:yes gene_type:complete
MTVSGDKSIAAILDEPGNDVNDPKYAKNTLRESKRSQDCIGTSPAAFIGSPRIFYQNSRASRSSTFVRKSFPFSREHRCSFPLKGREIDLSYPIPLMEQSSRPLADHTLSVEKENVFFMWLVTNVIHRIGG